MYYHYCRLMAILCTARPKAAQSASFAVLWGDTWRITLMAARCPVLISSTHRRLCQRRLPFKRWRSTTSFTTRLVGARVDVLASTNSSCSTCWSNCFCSSNGLLPTRTARTCGNTGSGTVGGSSGSTVSHSESDDTAMTISGSGSDISS